jgi:NAD+ diphosphatase
MSSETYDVSHQESLFFIFDGTSDGRVLISENSGIPGTRESFAFTDMLEAHGVTSKNAESDIWGVVKRGVKLPEGFRFSNRRDLHKLYNIEIFNRSGAAYQMMNLFLKNRFCGACGKPMTDHERDLARYCSSCGNTTYAALSPAVIVAVEKDGMLLLGHNIHFPSGRYSILAGFVDPGETLEDTIKRELFEEAGITVKNIRYFGSQPWPFPNSMMFGFNADWESGELTPDGEELSDVRWFAADNLPELPPSISISRRLIDDWVTRNS